MKELGIPENEEQRIEALMALDILGSGVDERFDRITRLAQKTFKVPIALVGLIDANRRWFKSRCGLAAEQTPRSISFCGHTILGEETFVIENALEDERFSDNPLVITGPPDIRFYAGSPLRSAGGYKLGTLCIIDNKPRAFSAEDVDLLDSFAEMVECELLDLLKKVDE